MIIVDSYKYKKFLLDPDAESFLTAASITDPTISGAINTLVVQMKADNIWTKCRAIYPWVGGSASTHKYNLKDPQDTDAAYRLTFSGGWTHDSNGGTPNGTNGYADTFFVQNNSNIANNNCHVSSYTRNNINGGVDIGFQGTNTKLCMYIYNRLLGNSGTRLGATTSQEASELTVSQSDSSGFFVTSRPTTTSHVIYKNGSQIATRTSVNNTTTVNTYKMFIGALNFDGAAAFYSSRNQAFNSFGDGMNSTELGNFYTAVQAFQTTLNRQV